jgi:hypothetical protein
MQILHRAASFFISFLCQIYGGAGKPYKIHNPRWNATCILSSRPKTSGRKGDCGIEPANDRDGESKTAEVHPHASPWNGSGHDEIARRAYQLWKQRGSPHDSAEQDWFEAAEQLRAKTNSQNALTQSESGSVQH